jgi:hypothetical protein
MTRSSAESSRHTRDGATDAIHQQLRRAVEKRQRSHLWTPADAITFVPRLLPVIYGDGRALFTIATINQRPAYWIIRACSTWGCGMDREDSIGPDFADMSDDVLSALEDEFGNGRCSYSGNSLFWPKKERIQNCQCEECADSHVAKWPEVDGCGGCSWSRMDWPADFGVIKNPLSRQGNLLTETISEAVQ